MVFKGFECSLDNDDSEGDLKSVQKEGQPKKTEDL